MPARWAGAPMLPFPAPASVHAVLTVQAAIRPEGVTYTDCNMEMECLVSHTHAHVHTHTHMILECFS